MNFRICWWPILLILLSTTSYSQKTRKKISLRDSLDHAFDLSDYIIDANGFVPVPYLITEPALGGIGLAVVPVFMKKKPSYRDSVRGKEKITPVPPDITGGLGAYTANQTWIVGAFRSGTWIRQRIKYSFGAAYANVNLSFYHVYPLLGEKGYEFNFKTLPVFLQATKRLGISNWGLGIKYLFLKTEIGNADSLPSFVKSNEINGTVSELGAVVEFDNRDNIFTPDNGLKLHVDGIRSDQAFGSDYDFWHLNYYTYIYKTISKKWIGGLRIDGQQIFGDPPFYLLPYINMRGIPTVRYQGKSILLTEIENRWDFYRRWSLVGFGGLGKAFDDWGEASDAPLVYSVGTGFRYLLARKFKLRVGIDVARGPEQWAYYIIFGSNWLK